MELEFWGAAQTVTGSMHIVHTPHARVLLECGLTQGRRKESYEKNKNLPFRARDIDVVVLSHAHIDHSGALPILIKNGFKGSIYVTPATRDLCRAMLEDAASIQQHDANYIKRRIERDHSDMEPVEPLYDMDDVVHTLERMIAVPYHQSIRIANGVDLTFYDAGHVLGSAIVSLDVDDEGDKKRLIFSGDVGQKGAPILRDPEVPAGGHVLLLESTYGDRRHKPREALDDDLGEVVARTYKRGGKVIIPSFALERAQEVIFALKRLRNAGRLPPMPVYVDSPLTVRITDIFRLHPDCYDAGARKLLSHGDSPFDFPELNYVEAVEDSKRVTGSEGPAIIISAGGMCEYGRILHHLRATIGSRENTIVIVGFQAQHTLGRRLVEGRSRVRIFGVEHERRAEVVVLDGFSAHADQQGLLEFADKARESGPLRNIFLVHGEPASQQTLHDLLEGRGFPDVRVPKRGERFRV